MPTVVIKVCPKASKWRKEIKINTCLVGKQVVVQRALTANGFDDNVNCDGTNTWLSLATEEKREEQRHIVATGSKGEEGWALAQSCDRKPGRRGRGSGTQWLPAVGEKREGQRHWWRPPIGKKREGRQCRLWPIAGKKEGGGEWHRLRPAARKNREEREAQVATGSREQEGGATAQVATGSKGEEGEAANNGTRLCPATGEEEGATDGASEGRERVNAIAHKVFN